MNTKNDIHSDHKSLLLVIIDGNISDHSTFYIQQLTRLSLPWSSCLSNNNLYHHPLKHKHQSQIRSLELFWIFVKCNGLMHNIYNCKNHKFWQYVLKMCRKQYFIWLNQWYFTIWILYIFDQKIGLKQMCNLVIMIIMCLWL